MKTQLELSTSQDILKSLRTDMDAIIHASLQAVLPDNAVKSALSKIHFSQGKLYMVAVGKAAWQMADAAAKELREKLSQGIVITKYGHIKGKLPHTTCYEAGHPVPDSNSYQATQAVIDMVSHLNYDDTVLFLLSGGGSALFEKPLISGEMLADITTQLLACGADITEINTIRKRLSAVKGGRFAKLCEPAFIYSIVLSDIVGDPLDMIASGPAYPDSSTSEQATEIARKYQLSLSDEVWQLLSLETPKELANVKTQVTGSVRNLCVAAASACEKLGYQPFILTDELNCEAREAGAFLAAIARTHQNTTQSLAFITGGETIVHLTGHGKGGRNQELALAAAEGIAGLPATALCSIGSDGTDGPTDAAGGYVDGSTKEKLAAQGVSIYETLRQNDAYYALQKSDSLVITGPTGTNVNDVAVLLIKR